MESDREQRADGFGGTQQKDAQADSLDRPYGKRTLGATTDPEAGGEAKGRRPPPLRAQPGPGVGNIDLRAGDQHLRVEVLLTGNPGHVGVRFLDWPKDPSSGLRERAFDRLLAEVYGLAQADPVLSADPDVAFARSVFLDGGAAGERRDFVFAATVAVP